MLNWLLGGTAEKAVSKISDGVDSFFFTDQEKSEAKKELFKLQIEMAKATAPQNLTRRIIASVITVLWALFLVVAVIMQPFDSTFSEFVFNTLNQNVNQPFSIILGFYFLSHIVSKIKK